MGSETKSYRSHARFRFADGGRLEQFTNENGLDRVDGPALIEFSADGKLVVEEYWINGSRVDSCPLKPNIDRIASPATFPKNLEAK